MKQTPALSHSQIAALQGCSSASVANAIETFNVRPRNQGYVGPEVRCLFPSLPPMVGYACTAVVSSRVPAPEQARVGLLDLWRHIESTPGPRVVVLHDMDEERVRGAFWGEVTGNIYTRLGCVGTVTDGGVRDLDEVRAMGFHFFAAKVCVSHAYIHVVEVGVPVEVGGLLVRPGDLLHGDQHGVVQVPLEIAAETPEAVRRVEERERLIIEYTRSKDFTVEGLAQMMGVKG